MKIEIGQQAPDFVLYDSGKNKVALSDQRGKNILLLFFPLAFTSVCTAELCSIRDNIALYNKSDAVIFGISVDSPYTLARFKEDQHLNFSLLSDFNKLASAAYGALYETFSMDLKGVSKRSAFVIDKNGIIKFAQVLDKASDLPDFSAIQSVLQSLNV